MFDQSFVQLLANQVASIAIPQILEAMELKAAEIKRAAPAPNDDDLIDVHEVARMLGCHPRTVVTKEKSLKGFPKGIRSGKRALRWSRGEIRAFISNCPRGVGNLTAL